MMELLTGVAEVGTFLIEHEELLKAIAAALEAGATKEAILLAVRQAMVEASDARMRAELAPENPSV